MRLIDADVLFKDICDAINEMIKIGIAVDGEWLWAKLNDALENALTIELKRETGEWIVTSEFEDCYYAKCNQCKVTQVFYHNKPLTNFCPNCGADMRGEQNED